MANDLPTRPATADLKSSKGGAFSASSAYSHVLEMQRKAREADAKPGTPPVK